MHELFMPQFFLLFKEGPRFSSPIFIYLWFVDVLFFYLAKE